METWQLNLRDVKLDWKKLSLFVSFSYVNKHGKKSWKEKKFFFGIS